MIPYSTLKKRRHFPIVTFLLLLLNISIFVVQMILPADESLKFIYNFSVIPLEFKLGMNLSSSLGPPPFLTVFSALFLHGGLLHLVLNMLYLWIFGGPIEGELKPFRFLIFYLLCGVIATFVQIYADFDSRIPVLGASGAIAGILAAHLWIFPKAKIKVLVPIFFFLRSVTLPAYLILLIWFLLQIIHLQLEPMNSGGGVAYFAHIGGFVAGLLLCPAFYKKKRKRK